MIRNKTKEVRLPIVIDLTGPDGNAFVLLGLAKKLGRQMGLTFEKQNAITEKMMAGDYENLIQVFDKEFGDFVILER